MSDAVWLAIIGVPVVLLTAIIPLFKQIIDNRNARDIREQEWARQDKLAQDVREGLQAVKTGVDLLERNTNSISARNEQIAKSLGLMEGEAAGRAAEVKVAEALAEGQRQGAAGLGAASVSGASTGSTPVPVADNTMAVVGERIALATEEFADAQKRVAKVAEEKPKK